MTNSDVVNDFLKHFGVKGMKWGVRSQRVGDTAVGGLGISTTSSRARASARNARKKSTRAEVRVSDTRKKLRTSGGKGLPAHPDAILANRIGQIVKKSGPKAVSTQDLQAYANRLQVEQNVSRLTSNNRSAGAKVSQIVLKQAGNKAIQEVTGGVMTQVKKTLLARMR